MFKPKRHLTLRSHNENIVHLPLHPLIQSTTLLAHHQNYFLIDLLTDAVKQGRYQFSLEENAFCPPVENQRVIVLLLLNLHLTATPALIAFLDIDELDHYVRMPLFVQIEIVLLRMTHFLVGLRVYLRILENLPKVLSL